MQRLRYKYVNLRGGGGYIGWPSSKEMAPGCPRTVASYLPAVLEVSSHSSATVRGGGGGHFCGRVPRLATSQGLRQLPPPRNPSQSQRESERETTGYEPFVRAYQAQLPHTSSGLQSRAAPVSRSERQQVASPSFERISHGVSESVPLLDVGRRHVGLPGVVSSV